LSRPLGFLVVVAAGLINPAFAVPLKYTKRWTFENTWMIFSVWGMMIVPWIIAWLTVPHLGQVYAHSGLNPLLMVFVFGAIWGTANILNGVGINLVGISLSGPLCAGMSVALGTIVPIWKKHAEALATPYGMIMMLGLVLNITGMAVISWAGALRDAQSRRNAETPAAEQKRGRGLVLLGITVNLLAGVFDPCLNYAFVFGDAIKVQALAHGAAESAVADAIWGIVLPGSFSVNALYCGIVMWHKKTWSRFSAEKTFSHWWLGATMGIIWMITITLYGRGAAMMGTGGGEIGWPVFYGCAISMATVWGLVTGEWREGKGRPLRTMFAGLGAMLVALVLFGYANTIAPKL
jgi:L-rhamnose-H+ transport protein